jgi:hypothetical protein
MFPNISMRIQLVLSSQGKEIFLKYIFTPPWELAAAFASAIPVSADLRRDTLPAASPIKLLEFSAVNDVTPDVLCCLAER